mmetsp:Transcript_107128/g.299908  ORF Transcript_107128/g.299908 Transcript_107128/m.299908 type:complete len:119 (-) Transcript_107128:913-1269(-)
MGLGDGVGDGCGERCRNCGEFSGEAAPNLWYKSYRTRTAERGTTFVVRTWTKEGSAGTPEKLKSGKRAHFGLRVPLRGVDKADAGDMSDLGLGNGGDSSAPPGDASSAGSLRCSSTPP